MKSADLATKWSVKWSLDTTLDLFYPIFDSIGRVRRLPYTETLNVLKDTYVDVWSGFYYYLGTSNGFCIRFMKDNFSLTIEYSFVSGIGYFICGFTVLYLFYIVFILYYRYFVWLGFKFNVYSGGWWWWRTTYSEVILCRKELTFGRNLPDSITLTQRSRYGINY